MTCAYCAEPLDPGAETRILGWHDECSFRTIKGSVAHIEHRCSCYVRGASETDPPGMTRREAARAALTAYRVREGIQ